MRLPSASHAGRRRGRSTGNFQHDLWSPFRSPLTSVQRILPSKRPLSQLTGRLHIRFHHGANYIDAIGADFICAAQAPSCGQIHAATKPPGPPGEPAVLEAVGVADYASGSDRSADRLPRWFSGSPGKQYKAHTHPRGAPVRGSLHLEAPHPRSLRARRRFSYISGQA